MQTIPIEFKLEYQKVKCKMRTKKVDWGCLYNKIPGNIGDGFILKILALFEFVTTFL